MDRLCSCKHALAAGINLTVLEYEQSRTAVYQMSSGVQPRNLQGRQSTIKPGNRCLEGSFFCTKCIFTKINIKTSPSLKRAKVNTNKLNIIKKKPSLVRSGAFSDYFSASISLCSKASEGHRGTDEQVTHYTSVEVERIKDMHMLACMNTHGPTQTQHTAPTQRACLVHRPHRKRR